MRSIRIMAVGDVVGMPGCEFVRKQLWNIRKIERIDFTIINGENSALGNGIDRKSAEMLLESGGDVITTGNHVWRKREIYEYLDSERSVLRPSNYPAAAPGLGYGVFDCSGYRVLVINLLGTVFMDAGLESAFFTVERIFKREDGRYDFAVIDFHAEATSEKLALAKYVDANFNCAAFFGTHTHVPTADAQVLKNGMGYITDIGMTGGADSILGIKNSCVIEKFLTKLPVKFETESENISLSGVVFDIDTDGFKCRSVKRVEY